MTAPRLTGSGAGSGSRPRRLLWLAPLLAATVTGAGCNARPTLSNGSITGCFRSLPVAKGALHDEKARLLGVHRFAADRFPRLTPVSTTPVSTPAGGDDDNTVCAVSFKGQFSPGQVTAADPSASGQYAVVVVDAKRLRVITSYVGTALPKALRGETL